MTKKRGNKKAAAARSFALGDRVKILHFGEGEITELCGPLGPEGAQVYRVRYARKPKAAYIEVLGSQLRRAKAAKQAKAPTGERPPLSSAPGAGENGSSLT